MKEAMRKALPMTLLLVALLIAFRVLGALQPAWLPNVQPLAALFFCAAACLRSRLGLLVPLGAWLVSLPLTNAMYGNAGDTSGLFIVLAGFGVVALLGHRLRGRGTGVMLGGVLASSLAFYVLTNLACWIVYPLYTKDLHGLVESLWTGPVGSAQPTWVFLRNSLAADTLFAAMFLLASQPLRKKESALVVVERAS